MERARLERVVEQIAGAPVPQILESFVDGDPVPKERVQNRVGEQIGAVPVLQIWEPIGEGVQLASQERVLNRTQEQIVFDNVPQIMEDDVEVVCVAPRERVQNHTPQQIVPVPRILEAAVEGVRAAPQECVVDRTPEQLVDEPVPQIAEEIVETPVPSERSHKPVVQQTSGRALEASMRELQDLRRMNQERNAFDEDEEEEKEEEDEDEGGISRFPPHFRPRLWCRFLLAGSTCPHGAWCTFAHHESELHPHSWWCGLVEVTSCRSPAVTWPNSVAWACRLGIPWTLLGCLCRSPRQ